MFAPSGVIGACIKQGRSDGFVELGGLAYYASSSSTEVYIGEGYKSWKAAVKYIGRKGWYFAIYDDLPSLLATRLFCPTRFPIFPAKERRLGWPCWLREVLEGSRTPSLMCPGICSNVWILLFVFSNFLNWSHFQFFFRRVEHLQTLQIWEQRRIKSYWGATRHLGLTGRTSRFHCHTQD